MHKFGALFYTFVVTKSVTKMKDRAVTFYIHNNNYVYANFKAWDGRLRISTGVTGDNIRTLPKAKKNTLLLIEANINKHVSDCSLAQRPVLKKSIENIILSITGRKDSTAGLTLSGLVERFISEAKAGAIRTKKGDVYSDSTVRLSKHLLNKLNKHNLASTLMQDITAKDIEKLSLSFANSDRYGDKEQGKAAKNGTASYINLLGAIISRSYGCGWHNNNISKEASLTHPVEAVDYPIYYSIEELLRLHKFEFTNPAYARLRDVFIFGCFTCLRHSDYYRTDYRVAVKDGEITVKLQKRKNQVKIPIHPIALEILDKYGYVLPAIKMRQFNKDIKKLTKLAGFTDKVLFSRTHGGVLKSYYKEKWELTTSHTMRRSFATNALKSGMEQWAVMSIGGWKSEASFKKYLRMSGEDVKTHALGSAFYGVRW